MNSQNRMNAGAEYVLYRIWATLQDENGIHAESLLTCVGALAGYACQACVRQTAALPGADPRKYALLTVDAGDGTRYLDGEALMGPLVESPLSVWSLVGLAVQKLEKPVPDIQEIVRHVTLSVGTSAFGVPRVLEGNRPRYPALACLKQLWPQILPIVQRFSRKPMQIPVLFGIALQRALEYTKDKLDPTLGASIAMECAVAMSRVVLPETAAAAAPASVQPAAAGATVSTSTSGTWAALTKGAPEKATPPNVTPALADFASKLLEPSRPRNANRSAAGEPRSRKKRALAALEESTAPRIRAFVARIPPAARMVTIASVAFIAMAGVMYDGDSGSGEVERPQAEVRQLVASAPDEEESPAFAQVEEATPEEAAFFAQGSPPPPNFIPAAQAGEAPPAEEEAGAPIRRPDAADEEPTQEYAALPSQADSSEGLMMDEFGQPVQ